jgi:hypothetical protein
LLGAAGSLKLAELPFVGPLKHRLLNRVVFPRGLAFRSGVFQPREDEDHEK